MSYVTRFQPYLVLTAYLALILVMLQAAGVIPFLTGILAKAGVGISLPKVNVIGASAYAVAVGVLCK